MMSSTHVRGASHASVNPVSPASAGGAVAVRGEALGDLLGAAPGSPLIAAPRDLQLAAGLAG